MAIETTPQVDDAVLEQGRTISLSGSARTTMKSLVESKLSEYDNDVPLFMQEVEAFRFACLLGIRIHGDTLVPIESEANSETFVNIGTLETSTSSASFIETIKHLAPTAITKERLTRVARRYAEWGLRKMQEWHEDALRQQSTLLLDDLIDKSNALISASSTQSKDEV